MSNADEQHCWHDVTRSVFAIMNPPHTVKCCWCGTESPMNFQHGDLGHGPRVSGLGRYVVQDTSPCHVRPFGQQPVSLPPEETP